jgi:hypothetical protein
MDAMCQCIDGRGCTRRDNVWTSVDVRDASMYGWAWMRATRQCMDGRECTRRKGVDARDERRGSMRRKGVDAHKEMRGCTRRNAWMHATKSVDARDEKA